MGNVQELRIDADTEVQAIEYVVNDKKLSEDGRNEILTFGTNGKIVTKKVSEVYMIEIWREEILGENTNSIVEKLIIGKNAAKDILFGADDYSGSNLKSIEYEEGTEEIWYSNFRYLTSLSSIKFPSTLKLIHGGFEECLGLKTITIPASVTTITNSAFYGCSNLETIYYEGTKEQWDKIEKSDGFSWINDNAKVIFSDGTEASFNWREN